MAESNSTALEVSPLVHEAAWCFYVVGFCIVLLYFVFACSSGRNWIMLHQAMMSNAGCRDLLISIVPCASLVVVSIPQHLIILQIAFPQGTNTRNETAIIGILLLLKLSYSLIRTL